MLTGCSETADGGETAKLGIPGAFCVIRRLFRINYIFVSVIYSRIAGLGVENENQLEESTGWSEQNYKIQFEFVQIHHVSVPHIYTKRTNQID